MEQPDEEVLRDYLTGNDEKAAEMIFLRYKTRLLNFCLRMLGNRADAEDVTAEVFLALFARRYAFNPAAKFSTWLYTVARNQCISQIRKRKNLVSVWFSSQRGGDYEETYGSWSMARRTEAAASFFSSSRPAVSR
ncbi:MAG TPA: hypothetical protein DE315_04500, partial [Candidatus Omnitrophica bacterium]|nr:hypothetical protein [Candidatus Omnitrophota bacterium]